MATTMRLARQIRTPEPSWTRKTGVVVVGAGAAGLSAAIQLLRARVPSVLVCCETFAVSASAWSTARVSVWHEPPSAERLLEQGEGLAEPAAVQDFIHSAPTVLEQLDDYGRALDSHTADPRQPAGVQVQRTLSAVVRTAATSPEGSLRVDTDRRAVDVLTDDSGQVAGLRVLGRDGSIGDYLAPVVVLASGGASQLWTDTVSPRSATGDGLAMGLRAGATMRDLEFVAFTPTALAVSARVALPGEPLVALGAALRRAGARVVGEDGQPALTDIGEIDSLSDRAFAVAVHDAIASGQSLFLDARGIGDRTWGLAPYLATARGCREHGVDPVHTPLPIRPAAQSLVGGVAVDSSGATGVPGLFAAGEVACTGAFGAEGPDNVFLAQALVTGHAAGVAVASASLHQPGPPAPRDPEGCVPETVLPGIRTAADTALGLSREHEQLRSAQDFLSRLPGDDDFSGANLTATNLRAVGAAISAAATARPETRGWHRRSDHPEPSPKWLRTITVACDENGSLTVTSAATTATTHK